MAKFKLFNGGTAEKIIDVKDLPNVPDLWHIAMYLEENGLSGSSKLVLDAWHLAHDMRLHIQEAA